MNGSKLVAWVFVAMLATPGLAKEVESGQDGVKDWSRIHRLAYSQDSLTLPGPQVVARLETSAPSFASAANANTKANRPGEYATFAQRTAYYDLISLVIEYEPMTAASVKPVRFFHATTMVTLRSMLGFPTLFANSGTEPLAKALGLCFAGAAVTKELIERVNVRLFETNMPVINKLLFKWKQPQHPTSGANASIDAFAFDLAMVELEQSTVEGELAAAKPSKAAIDEINKLFACDTAGGITGYLTGTFSALGTAKKWADSARSAPFDFSKKAHRVQLGQALVTMLHRKSEADFRKVAGL